MTSSLAAPPAPTPGPVATTPRNWRRTTSKRSITSSARPGKCRVTDLGQTLPASATSPSTAPSPASSATATSKPSPYGPVTLTAAGQKTARTARTRHEIVERFLPRFAGVGDRIAAIDFEGIEHHVNAETLRAMERFTNEHKPAPPIEEA